MRRWPSGVGCSLPWPCAGLMLITLLWRANPNSSHRLKLFSLCEIFHLFHRQASLAVRWLPQDWMGTFYSSRMFYCCLLYFAQTAFLCPCAQCWLLSVFFGGERPFVFLESWLKRPWLIGSWYLRKCCWRRTSAAMSGSCHEEWGRLSCVCIKWGKQLGVGADTQPNLCGQISRLPGAGRSPHVVCWDHHWVWNRQNYPRYNLPSLPLTPPPRPPPKKVLTVYFSVFWSFWWGIPRHIPRHIPIQVMFWMLLVVFKRTFARSESAL